jgi:hypothetical protein
MRVADTLQTASVCAGFVAGTIGVVLGVVTLARRRIVLRWVAGTVRWRPYGVGLLLFGCGAILCTLAQLLMSTTWPVILCTVLGPTAAVARPRPADPQPAAHMTVLLGILLWLVAAALSTTALGGSRPRTPACGSPAGAGRRMCLAARTCCGCSRRWPRCSGRTASPAA